MISDDIPVTWKCPKCGAENIDDYAWTAFPMCSECEADFWWEDIVTEEEQYKLNSELEAFLQQVEEAPDTFTASVEITIGNEEEPDGQS